MSEVLDIIQLAGIPESGNLSGARLAGIETTQEWELVTALLRLLRSQNSEVNLYRIDVLYGILRPFMPKRLDQSLPETQEGFERLADSSTRALYVDLDHGPA